MARGLAPVGWRSRPRCSHQILRLLRSRTGASPLATKSGPSCSPKRTTLLPNAPAWRKTTLK
ncbi:hypothetical protein FQ192_13995 [Pseudomonas sp. ANT_J12]|nr:hypothetical protein FQ192_13995 [Pseudomonas sp. ANT_J12]